MKTYIFIDGEYTFTCAVREGQVPDYLGLLRLLNVAHPDNVKSLYLVSESQKKKGLTDFLIKSGVDYVTMIPYANCSKTQMIAATLALDVAKISHTEKNCIFAFVTGDDYMMPIVHYLTERAIPSYVYYFPVIHYCELDKMACRMVRLPHLFMYPKKVGE